MRDALLRGMVVYVLGALCLGLLSFGFEVHDLEYALTLGARRAVATTIAWIVVLEWLGPALLARVVRGSAVPRVRRREIRIVDRR